MFEISGRPIGPGQGVYVIAELSANHRGSREDAERLVRAAHDCGADAVKLQTYTADTLTLDCDRPCFRIGDGSLWSGRTLYDLYQEAFTPWEWQPELKELAAALGMHCFSSPFDATAVDFLETMEVPAYKIASFELVDHPLLRKVATTGKPVIMSTGMATLGEIDEAVGVLRTAGCPHIALLKCTSAYPARPEDAHLRTIPHLAAAYGVPVGLSDHTLGIAVPVAAVALGASIIEKHLTLDRALGGPDAAFSLEPREFREMVDAVRVAERAMGDVHYGGGEDERLSRQCRRSLFVVADVRRGERFTPDNVRSIRPGDGLAPKYFDSVVGQTAAEDLPRGTPLAWRHVA